MRFYIYSCTRCHKIFFKNKFLFYPQSSSDDVDSKRIKKLAKELLALERAYALLQAHLGSAVDAERDEMVIKFKHCDLFFFFFFFLHACLMKLIKKICLIDNWVTLLKIDIQCRLWFESFNMVVIYGS